MVKFNFNSSLATVIAVVPTVCSMAQEKPMNVIFIMSDDHTSQAIGAYGSHLVKLNPTPNIDELASDGVVFDNCFCTNSISTPSRACIMTGQYSHHNEVLTLDEKLDVDRQYLVKEFSKMGYQTAMVGKWHLKNEPANFDYYKVLNGHGGQGEYFNPTFLTNEISNKEWPKNQVKTNGYSSDVITNITIDWLKNRRDKNKPFFLMHHYKAPHDMFEYAPRYKYYLEDTEVPVPESLYNQDGWGSEATRGKNDSLRHFIGTSISRRHENRSYAEDYKINTGDPKKDTYEAYQRYLKDYLRCVKGVDDNLKRLFDYLKKEGLWENTIIVYTGDQGMMLGEHDLQDKRWMYDESMRMPFIVRDPKSKQRGVHNDLMINNIDFAPTLIELAGGKAPEYMDGKSFADVFEGKTPANWKDEVYYRYWMHMIHHDIPAHIGIRTKDYKLILFYGRHYDEKTMGTPSMWWLRDKGSHKVVQTPVAFELYDLKKDPMEMKNVANDPEYKDVLKDMKVRLAKLREKVGDTDEKYPKIKAIIDNALKN